MTEPGETEGYTLADHLDAIRSHVAFDLFDYVLINRRAVDASTAAQYGRRGSWPVVHDGRRTFGKQPVIIERDLAWQFERGKIRHAPIALANAILELARLGRPADVPGFDELLSGPALVDLATATAL
jgi:2-phospho-L-lactate transferase/gluconeogenesis factor (CofD/UPF0052 family)